jgi:hypothetical protein
VRSRAGSDAARLLLMVGSVLTGAICVAAAAAGLLAFGLDIKPLLASLGASSLVIGLAMQDLLKNVASAVTLYTARPFVVGDKVILRGGDGGAVVQGTLAGHASGTAPRRQAAALRAGGSGTVLPPRCAWCRHGGGDRADAHGDRIRGWLACVHQQLARDWNDHSEPDALAGRRPQDLSPPARWQRAPV